MTHEISQMLGMYVGFRNAPEKGKLYGKVTSIEKRDGFFFLNVKGLHQPKYGKTGYRLPPEAVWVASQEEMRSLGAKYGK